MDPIKIQIEVGLKDSTLQALVDLFGGVKSAPASAPAAPAKRPMETKTEATAPAQAAAPAPEPAPAVEDLPPDDAPDPTPAKPTPTEDDARQAVKAARTRGVPAPQIKAYMKDTFGIASSVECPAERRQELIDGLAKLVA